MNACSLKALLRKGLKSDLSVVAIDLELLLKLLSSRAKGRGSSSLPSLNNNLGIGKITTIKLDRLKLLSTGNVVNSGTNLLALLSSKSGLDE